MAKKVNIVKKSKNNLNLLLIAMLAIGWLCAISALTSNEDEEAQAQLVAQAQIFMEDKLYIRAVQNYTDAINNYQTAKNTSIEAELLAIYLEADMMDEYYALVERRVNNATALENEYIDLAKFYMEKGRTIDAILTLKDGIDIYSNDEMITLKESILYGSKIDTIEWSELKQTGKNIMIPASAEGKWGYVRYSGNVALDFIYDEVTAFCGGYAVVKLDGVYTLIDEDGYWNAVDKNGLDKVTDISSSAIVGVKDGKYQIYSRVFNLLSEETFDNIYLNENGLYVVQKDGRWAILDANLKPVTEYIYTDVAVNSKGRVFEGNYAVVADETGYFLITADGKALYEERFANAKGMEGGIYAVANANGLWGFADENAEMVVDYQYEDAYSFSSRLGAVKKDGSWGYINQYNTMIIDAEYTSVYPFVDDTGIAETEMGTYEVLTLRYFDHF